MPSLGRWVQTIVSCTAIIGAGVLVVKYTTPTDEEFINRLSPELRKKYEAEKAMRDEFGKMMAEKMEASRDNPAWLKGMDQMNKLDRQVAESARNTVEGRERDRQLGVEREKLRKLAEEGK